MAATTASLAGCGGSDSGATLEQPTGVPAPIPAPVPAPTSIDNLQPGQWLELPNTKIRSVLPSPLPGGYPTAITEAWSGGTVDPLRNRLLVWGGGHSDYAGNEVYALDLPTMSIKRVVEPSSQTSSSNCTASLPDGKPTSRHTYDGLTFITHADRFFGTNGSLAPCGGGSQDAWTYDFNAGKWQLMTNAAPTWDYGTMAEYDPVSKLVYIKDLDNFYSYSYETNSYKKLSISGPSVDYHLSGTIDTKRRKFVMLGNGVQVLDLNTLVLTTVATSNAPGLVKSQESPGVAYDPVADRIVAWQGGGQVWTLDMDTKNWTQVAQNAGPTMAAPYQGTFGRWGYIPQYRVFALINDIDHNAWVFRLTN